MNIPETLKPLASIIAEGIAYQVFPFPGFDRSNQWPWDGYNPAEGLDYEWPDSETIWYRRPNWRNYSNNDCPLVFRNVTPSALDDVSWGNGIPLDPSTNQSRVSTLHISAGAKVSKTLKNTETVTHSLLENATVGLQLSFKENFGSVYNPADKVSATLEQTISSSYSRTWGSTTATTVDDSQTIDLPVKSKDRDVEIYLTRSVDSEKRTVDVPPIFDFSVDLYLPTVGGGSHVEGTWGSFKELMTVFKGDAPDSTFWGAVGRAASQRPISQGGQHLVMAAHKASSFKAKGLVTWTGNSVTVIRENTTIKDETTECP